MEVKAKRLKSNLKIKGICEELGISRSTYYLIEVGQRKLKKEEQEKLDKLFDERMCINK
ncbi:helix-turn-helix protein [Clostridium puniceum]|uniref:Helix-turn-helix protein n=1 Tax=Clostridium puniceum TaxID=29367 RepID=A0A1S8TVU9_9CLOT|nr:helix-turn-helix transcriptional regulator [Clostridium puniceum]OOM81841.1 helix-turn-helix protein [Clostridium puniceum]